MATLINGDGNQAVYAAQDADWFAGVEGDVTKILPIGLRMAYEIEDANTIAVKNGVIVTKEGRRIQIDAGSIDEFIIPTGSQGVIRYFIIGYHLYTDSSSNQLCETFVQLMTSESETITENTFRGGATEVYVSLYRVKQDGLNLDTITSLLPEGLSLKGLSDATDQRLGSTDISGIGDGTVTGAIAAEYASLTELGTGVYVGGGAIGGTGPINHNSITPYRYIQLQLRSGSAIVQVVTVTKAQFTNTGNYYYMQYMVPETNRTLTCYFHNVSDTQTTFTCVSTVSDFQGWSTAVIGIK